VFVVGARLLPIEDGPNWSGERVTVMTDEHLGPGQIKEVSFSHTEGGGGGAKEDPELVRCIIHLPEQLVLTKNGGHL